MLPPNAIVENPWTCQTMFKIQPQFDEAQPFMEGLAAVAIGHKFGFINPAGAFAIQRMFDEVDGGFSEGLAPVCVDDKWGYVDLGGRFVISPRFDQARPFREGLAGVGFFEQGIFGY